MSDVHRLPPPGRRPEPAVQGELVGRPMVLSGFARILLERLQAERARPSAPEADATRRLLSPVVKGP